MGATDFHHIATGKTADEAFRAAQKEALHWHGHGGYTGTIAEKPSFVLYPTPSRAKPEEIMRLLAEACYYDGKQQSDAFKKLRHWYASSTVDQMVRLYQDKWGPAIALQINRSHDEDLIPKTPTGKRKAKVFAFEFFGSASC